mmetsp:Transcript_11674/g.17057  ORF Transcript_11674/g.17057 Transcript_11674/m.17057 type:complete len:1354 (+) Transcript_11674:448-4509(+)
MKSNMKPNMKPRSKFFPQTIVTPKEAARRVAAARAYALGDTTAQSQPQTQHIVSGTNGKVASSGTKTGTSTGTGVGVTGTAIAPPLLAGTGTHSSRPSVPASKLTSRPLPTSGNNNNNKLGSPLTKTKGPQQMIQNQYEAARSLAEQFPSGNGNGNSGDPNHDPDTVGKLGMGNTTTNINAVGSVRYSLPTMGAGGLGLGQQHHQQPSQLGHGHVHVHGSVVRPPSRIAQSYRLMEIDDEEYAKFVRSLWIDDEIEDDEEDYCEGDDDEDDGDEDDDDNDDNEGDSEKDKEEDGEKDTPSGDIGDASAAAAALPGTPASKSTFVGLSEKNKKDPLGLDDLDFDLFDPLQLEEELGGLLEEDMEAAVSSLIMQDSMGMGMGMGMGGSSSNLIHHHNHAHLRNELNGVSGNGGNNKSSPSSLKNKKGTNVGVVGRMPSVASPSEAVAKAASSAYPVPTDAQVLRLQQLMNQHYQILLQQSVLAVRSAHLSAHGNKLKKEYGSGSTKHKEPSLVIGIPKRKRVNDFFFSGENADDLGAIVDGAVNMLQDLDKNRKDAIRYSIQMKSSGASMNTRSGGSSLRRRGYVNMATQMQNKRTKLNKGGGAAISNTNAANTAGIAGSNGNGTSGPHGHSLYPTSAPSAARTILGNVNDNDNNNAEQEQQQSQSQGCLTRSKFEHALRETDMIGSSEEHSNSMLGATTTFGVRGLVRLDETFAAIDNSLLAQQHHGSGHIADSRLTDGSNIFDEVDHGRACEKLLRHARADYDRTLVPGYRDLSYLLTYPTEVTGGENSNNETSVSITSKEQQRLLRQNRSQFTAAEDNLLLRGVNLYGEKEWMFISDRFLPDRSISIIAQRYWRLCFLIYKGHGIYIDDKGNFIEPPLHLNGIDDFDEAAIQTTLTQVKRPGVFGLYRWSMEEDVMLLKAVPLMGRMFAEIGKRFVSHRDRGALRKRYQVLERRVKGAIKRDKKSKPKLLAAKRKAQPGPPPKIAKVRRKATPAVVVVPPTQVRSTALKFHADKISITPKGVLSHPPLDRSGGAAQSQSHNHGSAARGSMPTYAPGAAVPAPPPGQAYPINRELDDNKTDFEKFTEIIDGEWSQMSNMRRIIESDSTNLVPPTTKAPGVQPSPQTQTQYLPTMNYNENNSMSGFSMLGNNDDKQKDSTSSTRKQRAGESIMKSVFDRTKTDSSKYTKAPPSQTVTDINPNSMDGFGAFNPTFEASKLGIEHSLMAPPKAPPHPRDSSELDAANMLVSFGASAIGTASQMSETSIPLKGASASLPASESPFQPPRNTSIERNVSSPFKVPRNLNTSIEKKDSSPFHPPRNTNIEKNEIVGESYMITKPRKRSLFQSVIGSRKK